jgi:small-conductance mechanosensitive channel
MMGSPVWAGTTVLPNTNTNSPILNKLPANPWNYGSFDESFQGSPGIQDSVPVLTNPVASPDTLTSASADTTNIETTVSQDSVNQSENNHSGAVTDSSSTAVNPQQSGNSEGDSGASKGIPSLTEIISVSKVISVIFVLILVWLGTRFVATVLTNMSERFQNYRLAIKRIIPIFKVASWSLGLYFVIAGILQPPLETIITVSASVGIAVGFASQDILRNVFGGIMIILDKPFQVGDKIDVDGNYGEVTEIGLRSVRIVTEDDSIVTIPNAEIMNKSVSNSNSSALDCQVVAELFLDSNVDIGAVSSVCKKAAMTSKYAYLNKPIFVHATHGTLGPRDFVKIRLKAYVLDIRFEQELRSDMTNLAMGELRRLGLVRN